MSGHTKGPWVVHPRSQIAITIKEDETGFHIATCWNDKQGSLPMDANARLIAEAPAMLEALQWIAMTAGAAYHSQGAGVVAAEMERAARAILARIDGGA